MNYISSQDYLDHLSHHATLPEGFTARTHHLAFTPAERVPPKQYHMKLSMLSCPATHCYACLTTKNSLPGASILLARERLAQGPLEALLLNNCIANTLTDTSYEDAVLLTRDLARLTGANEHAVLSISTGIIGWRLPVTQMKSALPALVAAAPANGLDLAQAIMTTDRYPKLIRRTFSTGGSMLGVAKGAGMIEPHMATMLAFILTDVQIDQNTLRKLLFSATEESFHALTVDSDSSTNDIVLALSSGLGPKVPLDEFEAAMRDVSGTLAAHIVRNGEGVSHVVSYEIRGMSDAVAARHLGKTVANSPLVKSAIAGNDPNVGRLLMAIGKHVGSSSQVLDMRKLVVHLGATEIFSHGNILLDAQKEATLSKYLQDMQNDAHAPFPQDDKSVEIVIDFHQGDGAARVLGGDLTKEYIKINAEYRT